MIFPAEGLRLVRQGKAGTILVKPSDNLRPMSVVRVRQSTVDEKGNRGSKPVHRVIDEERVSEVATIFAVEERVVVSSRRGKANITLKDARACGYRTTEELVTAWKAEYPILKEAAYVVLRIGDHLDHFHGLRAQMGSRDDYTASPALAIRGEGEALRPDEYSALGMTARQTTAHRKANTAAKLASQPMHLRIAAIERAGDDMRAEIRSELYILGQQATKGAKSLKVG